jgi:hypothetical protein
MIYDMIYHIWWYDMIYIIYDICITIYDMIYLLTTIGLTPGGTKLYKQYLSNEHHKPPGAKHRYTQTNPEKNVVCQNALWYAYKDCQKGGRANNFLSLFKLWRNVQSSFLSHDRHPWNPTWVSSFHLLAVHFSYLRRSVRCSNVNSLVAPACPHTNRADPREASLNREQTHERPV